MTAFQMRRTPRGKIVQPPQLPKSNRFRRTPRDKIVQPDQAHNKRMTKMALKLPRANATKCSTKLPNKTYKQIADVPTQSLCKPSLPSLLLFVHHLVVGVGAGGGGGGCGRPWCLLLIVVVLIGIRADIVQFSPGIQAANAIVLIGRLETDCPVCRKRHPSAIGSGHLIHME